MIYSTIANQVGGSVTCYISLSYYLYGPSYWDFLSHKTFMQMLTHVLIFLHVWKWLVIVIECTFVSWNISHTGFGSYASQSNNENRQNFGRCTCLSARKLARELFIYYFGACPILFLLFVNHRMDFTITILAQLLQWVMLYLSQADWKALHGALVGCLALLRRKCDVGMVTSSDAKAVGQSCLRNLQVQSLGQHDRKVGSFSQT